MKPHFPTVPVDEVPIENRPEMENKERPIILLVQDDPLIVSTLTAVFSRAGLVTLPASCGTEALDCARQIPPDLLIADMKTNDMHGLDLVNGVREFSPDCQAILITGASRTKDADRNKHVDGHGFTTLQKPVFPAELLDCIFKLLAHSFDREEADGMEKVAAQIGMHQPSPGGFHRRACTSPAHHRAGNLLPFKEQSRQK